MNQINITLTDDERIAVDFGKDSGTCLHDLIAIFFAVLENSTKQVIDDADQDTKEYLYDLYDGIFYTFMEKVFPDIQPRDFDLSDAAILYAQDQIIKRAEKKGMTFDEALEWYENKAKEHILASERKRA